MSNCSAPSRVRVDLHLVVHHFGAPLRLSLDSVKGAQVRSHSEQKSVTHFPQELMLMIGSLAQLYIWSQSRKAVTTWGSNWVSEQRRNSARASSTVQALL